MDKLLFNTYHRYRAINVIKLSHQQGFQPLSGRCETLSVVENSDSGDKKNILNLMTLTAQHQRH
mgnify:CR=1 FL=1